MNERARTRRGWQPRALSKFRGGFQLQPSPLVASHSNHEYFMSSCTFCRIISQEIGSAHLSENELAIAFLDIRPINRGHALVVPRRHTSSFTDLTDSESTAVFRLIQEIASALRSELPECAGITLSAADGDAAGQEVPHAHFHVIPRFSGDDFGWRRFGTPASSEALATTASLIRRSVILDDPH